VIANLAAWTAPGGSCLLPLADPDLIARTELPDGISYGPTEEAPREIRITGIVSSYLEETGEAHRHLVSPSLAWMRDELGRHSEVIETIRYAPVSEFIGRRPAVVASPKRPDAV
jgi:hypothetical protein